MNCWRGSPGGILGASKNLFPRDRLGVAKGVALEVTWELAWVVALD